MAEASNYDEQYSWQAVDFPTLSVQSPQPGKASTDDLTELETLASLATDDSNESDDSDDSIDPNGKNGTRSDSGGNTSDSDKEDDGMLGGDTRLRLSKDKADLTNEDALQLSQSEILMESTTAGLNGFNGPNSIKVVFHLIIPKPLWGFDDSSKVFLRLGCEDLGGWGRNIGTFSSTRDISEVYCEMTSCVLWINQEVLQKCIPYKYVVFTPKTKLESNKTLSYVEFLGGSYSRTVKRALNLSRKYLQEGTYHQYDTMALPEDWSGSATEKMRSIFSSRKLPPQLKTPSNLLEVRQISLELYLENCSATSDFIEPEAIEKYVERVYHIYVCITKVSRTHSNVPTMSASTENITKKKRKWFGAWLLHVIKGVHKQPAEKQLQFAVCSLWCLRKLNVPFDSEEVKALSSTLLKFLCAQEPSDKEHKQWKEYDKLCCFFLNHDHREMIAEATKELSLVCAAASNGVLKMDWMYGIPLYSFLTDQFIPNESICSKSDQSLTSLWTHLSEKFYLKRARKKFRKKENKFVEGYMNAKVKGPLSLDPLTLLACVYICPDADLRDLFVIIPPNISVTWLSYIVSQETPEFNRNIHNVSYWNAWIKGIKSNLSKGTFSSVLDYSVLETSARNLFQRTTLYIQAPLKDSVCIVFAAASLFCTVLKHLHGDLENILTEVSEKIISILREWINNTKIIGIRMFGYDETAPRRSNKVFPKGSDEVEVWKVLLSLGSEDHQKKLWIEIVGTLFSERIKNVPASLLVQLFQFVELRGNQFLIKQVMPHIAKAADYFLSIKCPDEQLERVDEITRGDSKMVGRVLDKILRKKYSEIDVKELECDWITLDMILKWALWPCYLRLQTNDPGYTSLLMNGLSKECQRVCVAARSKVRMVFFHLQQDRKVTLNDLHGMITNIDHVEKLCKAVEEEKFAYTLLSQALDKGKKELLFLQKHKHAYQAICDLFHDTSKVKGLTSLKQELAKDIGKINICDLCQLKDDTLVLKYYDIARPLDPIVEHISIMMLEKPSDLFLHFFSQKIQTVLNSTSELTIADILPEIWQPVFAECQELLNSLLDQSIKLLSVDTHFKAYFQDSKKLETVLKNLAEGVSMCLNEEIEEGHLQKPLESICEYWKLCEYQVGTELLLQLREMLKLEGDFELVEKFSSQLTQSLKEECLKFFDSGVGLSEMGSFLKETISDHEKCKCLETFIDCKEIVVWLKDNSESVNDIQGFVTVALATAAGGEGDLAHDRLSHLRTVCSGFASLIYHIRETDGYMQLMEGCKSLWKALEKNPNLPKLLVRVLMSATLNCNEDLEWYKLVRDTRGTVEKTSYGQMTNILKYGTYRVGFKGDAQTIHDLVSVVLHQQNQLKSNYTLDELKDLESKLVLTCGSKSEVRAEVDHYLNLLYSATRIAELYLNLQQAGDVTFSTTCLYFRCAVYDEEFNVTMAEKRVTELQDYTQRLNKQLLLWNKNVDAAREKYYELNCFTTLQLLELRREFGHLKQPAAVSHSVEPRVLMLLKGVSPHISDEIVSQALQVISHESIEASRITNRRKKSSLSIGSNADSETVHTPEWKTPLTSPDPSPPVDSAFIFKKMDGKQKDIYTHCVDFLGYSKSHVLRAFQACGLGADMYKIETWCESNDDPEQEDDDDGDEVSAELEDFDSIESDSVDMGNSDHILPHAIANSAMPGDHRSSFDSSYIKTIVRETVDEAHPDVRELVKAGYDLDKTVRAVSLYRDPQLAMRHLDSQEDDHFEVETNNLQQFISREDMEDIEFEKIVEDRDGDASKGHLELEQLGRVLETINKEVEGAVTVQRTFNPIFKAGLPNLLVTSPDNVLRCVLGLYASDIDLPLPTPEEVLLCTSTTTAEEVNLLWRRATRDPGFKRIFCLAHAENLSYQVCDGALRSLAELSQGRKCYRLVVICSKEAERKSPIITRLHTFKRTECTFKESHYKDYLQRHFVSSPLALPGAAGQCASEAKLDKNSKDASVNIFEEQTRTLIKSSKTAPTPSSSVLVVSSTRSGMGKSLYITRRADKLNQATTNQYMHVIIPIHGPTVTNDILMDFFNQHRIRSAYKVYHLDIAPQVLKEVDCHLFSLLILKGLSDSRGNVWRCHPNQFYMVEVTVPTKNKVDGKGVQTLNLLKLLPTIKCVRPKDVKRQQQTSVGVLGIDEKVLRSSTFQRVYAYLSRYSTGKPLDKFIYHKGSLEVNTTDFIRLILDLCGVKDPSWTEVHHFTRFLDIQLHSCEKSVFFNERAVGGLLPGLKGFVVKFMIRMSQDFSTPSLPPNTEKDKANDLLREYQIVQRRQWEQSSHPYIFFNEDRVSITFVGFKVNDQGELIDPRTHMEIEPGILDPTLYLALCANKVSFKEDYRDWNKPEKVEKLTTVMGCKPYDPDRTYVLTSDNLVKMLAIHMRFRCDIPVVIMGETGCGKTRLIRYMCDVARQGRQLRNMLILKIHGGITDQDIICFMENAERQAQQNRAIDPKLDTVVFFDEANTTESIGLIKEIMCDRRINGKAVSKDLKFIAACNPYRKHSDEMIYKLEHAGLGFHVSPREKLGNIPLRKLVYRVFDIPPSMRPLVYDFGQLRTDTEYDYILQIVKNQINKNTQLGTYGTVISPAIATVLNDSQQFMRDQKGECSFVSLRDVERAVIVFEFFYEKMQDVFIQLISERASKEYLDEWCQSEDEVNLPPPLDKRYLTTSMILALCVCYHARLQKRADYEEFISASFMDPLNLPRGAQQFRNEIRWCQEGLLDHMVVGPNIAKNAALRENVFIMVICIELRIPLFLVGKPGSSKSLAKSIIQDSMHGQGSRSPLLKNFKQVHLFSYQCSQLSTPESIIEVFKSAEKFQSSQDIQQYVSIVVLDEVGLAEDSPSLPLKALHPLLEDGTVGSGKDHQHQAVEREKRVAFIGISNWALDPAKMNRGVMITREEPELQELEFSANGICSTENNDPIREQLQQYFEPLSRAYIAICQKQERQFFGLRDFYSLIKMLYWMSHKSKGQPLTMAQLEHAIKRNFGGLESTDLNPLKEFQSEIGSLSNNQELSDNELNSVLNPDCTSQGLIKASLNTRDTTWHGENRYLLFLTENFAALNVLKHFLNISSTMSGTDLTSQPFVLFGSSFPKDNDFTHVCRNINQIKICMETGRTVILLNLEHLYASLYDVLNQYYMYYSGTRYVDLGLQTNKVKCRVHQDFKLILIAEKDTVYKSFPTPLINRLEKHFVLTSTILEEWQCKVLEEFNHWIKHFSQTSDSSGNKFEEAHAFVGYQKDTPAAVVFQATLKLQKIILGELSDEAHYLQRAGIFDSDFLQVSDTSAVNDSPQWSEAVLRLGKFLLLQTAADDAVIRLRESKLPEVEIKRCLSLYYGHQHHRSLSNFLQYACTGARGMFMQVTTHSPLMSRKEVMSTISETHLTDFACFNLHEFDTAVDFSNNIGPIFLRKENKAKPFIVIIQCDSVHLKNDLIACARYRVYDDAIEAKVKNQIRGRHSTTHVVFIVRVPQQEVKSQFVGFEGEPWICVHIDELRTTTESTILPQQADSAKISELFIGNRNETKQGLKPSKGKLKPVFVKESAEDEGENVLELHLPSESFASSIQIGPSTSQPVHKFSSLVGEDDDKKEDHQHTDTVLEKVADCEPLHAQHRRLYGCIQAAVSMLNDLKEDRSKQRIQKLLCFFSKSVDDRLDGESFYALLVRIIYLALKQRESKLNEKNWAVTEARSGRKLQNGGTFRNVLARRIDEVITPYFAKVIAYIDQNFNLDLLDTENQVSKFWLAMFSLSGSMIDFGIHSVTSRKITVTMDFHCKFPFSWLVKEIVDGAVYTEVYQISVQENQQDVHQHNIMHKCVEHLSRSETNLGKLLSKVSQDEINSFYCLYLHDFVRFTYKTTHRDEILEMEYELIGDALDAMTKNPELNSEESLVHKIVALHLVYKRCCSEVYEFRQLVQHRPGILHDKRLHPSNDQMEFTLHLRAVQRVLESDQEDDPVKRKLIGLNPPIQSEEQDEVTLSIHRWLNHVRMSQNIIDTILKSKYKTEVDSKARIMWQRVQANQIFAEKVYIPHSEVQGMLFVIRRLDINLKKHSNFLKLETLEGIKNSIYKALTMKKLKADDSTKQEIKKHCNDFFIEMVSRLCFGGRELPDTKVFSSLFDMIFPYAESTKLQTIDVKFISTPAIKSFLLQLLLEHTPAHVEEYLESYFHRPINEVGREPDQKLCLLCIQCFEDAFSKKICTLPSDRQVRAVIKILDSKSRFLCQDSQAKVTLKYLQSVAEARLSLFILAEQLMNKQADCSIIRSFCVDPRVRVFDVSGKVIISGPVLYLIKVLVRKLGFPCLNTVSKTHPWIVPRELTGSLKEILRIDPFVIYDKQYKNVREAVNTAISTQNTEELAACVGVYKQCFLAFAIYQTVTLTRASKLPLKEVPNEVLHIFNTFIEEFSGFSDDMRHMMRLLLVNQQGGNLAQLTVSPDQPALCRILGSVIVHTVAVILSVSKTPIELLSPFGNILNANSRDLLVAYLPTMPEDQLQEVKKAGSIFLGCPNGHPCFIGACGSSVKKGVCKECGAVISGVTQQNQRLNDTTKTGHDLGNPEQRSLNPECVRDLSAPAVCIVRAIMHSAFVWAACRKDQDQLLDIAAVTNFRVPPENLPEFFWMHLEKDIKCLMQCMGRGVDECAIVIHLVLQQIMHRLRVESGEDPSAEIDSIKKLQSKVARRKWEQLFHKLFIDPVLSNLDDFITNTLDRISSDEQQDNKHLFQLLFKNVSDHRLQALLWDIQPRINLEHLKRSVQANRTDSSSVRALAVFLEAEHSLRATQYLPDIVKLQKFIFDMYDKQLMKGEANLNTVEKFLSEVEQKFNEHTKRECRKMIESLRCAWLLVRHKLRNHSNNRLVVEEKHLQKEFSLDTPLVYLLPTTMGEGKCTTALVDYLVLTHNDFIEKCRGIVTEGAESAAVVWREYKVPIAHIHHCHMLEYELHIQSIILSHCHYSVNKRGHWEIEYDLPALGKHILNQFVYGKPTILLDIPNIAFRKDVYTMDTFMEIRHKVNPQVPLDQPIQQDILTELTTPEKMRESLDVVEIVIGLLCSKGSNTKAGILLKDYIDFHKMAKKPFSAKAKQHCTLGHIISLWETISVELARLYWERGQEPFESIPRGYVTKLKDGQKEKLDKCLRMFDLGALLGALFQFIEVHVKQITTDESANDGLVQGLDRYWKMTEQKPIPDLEHFRKTFPNSITFSQAVAAWKHIAGYKINVQ